YSQPYEDDEPYDSFPTRRSSDLGPFVSYQAAFILFPGPARAAAGTARRRWSRRSSGGSFERRPGLSSFEFAAVPSVSKAQVMALDRKSTRLNSSHVKISDAVFCL